jgi:hypothetical protein
LFQLRAPPCGDPEHILQLLKQELGISNVGNVARKRNSSSQLKHVKHIKSQSITQQEIYVDWVQVDEIQSDMVIQSIQSIHKKSSL